MLAGWIVIVFGTSLLIFFFSPLTYETYHSNPILNALRTVWEIADEMGPAVKLSLVLLFGTFVFLFKERIRQDRVLFYASSIGFALLSMLLVLALLPADLSRGYGVGLTGRRFDGKMMPIYATGAFLGGAAFAYMYRRLSASK
ncbi:hypothetical protein GCM10027275_35150 [Rhabdobacter roseus]